MTVFEKIETQQAKLKDTEPAWMVGEQLKDICRSDPHCATIVDEDRITLQCLLWQRRRRLKSFFSQNVPTRKDTEQMSTEGV